MCVFAVTLLGQWRVLQSQRSPLVPPHRRSHHVQSRCFVRLAPRIAPGVPREIGAAGFRCGRHSACAISRSAHAAGSDTIKIGLIGCGGRGSGAAADALSGDPNTQLWAMADVFADKIEASVENLHAQNSAIGSRSTRRGVSRAWMDTGA